jgi:ferric-dicitrate binding protein FerR (iron transport regulator)
MVLLTIGWVYWNTKAVRQHTPIEANAFIEKVNQTDHATSYQLDDGSIVWLKPHSLLRYPNKFRNEAREVYLEGEAFFEVAHNAKKPFRVYSNQLIVRVLGTSFTVKAFRQDSTAEVAVRTGRVSVYSVPLEKMPSKTGFSSDQAIEEAEKSSTLLTPNQKAVFYAAAQRLVTDEVKQADYWEKEEAQHQFNFTNAPLDEVMGMLEETYGVSIELENDALKHCTLTATMGNQSLETKLEMICKSIGATFEQNESTIYIKGKGCE